MRWIGSEAMPSKSDRQIRTTRFCRVAGLLAAIAQRKRYFIVERRYAREPDALACLGRVPD
jgi:hypothetical protein